MKYPISYLIIFFLMGFQINSSAQASVTSGGGNSSGTGGAISFTIGQTAFSSISSPLGSITQGVQQPFEISVMTGIENQSILLSWSVYPNPVDHNLTLNIGNYDGEKFSYNLFDVNGNLLEDERISGIETTISMADFLSGIYFIRVHNKGMVVKTFKVIKN